MDLNISKHQFDEMEVDKESEINDGSVNVGSPCAGSCTKARKRHQREIELDVQKQLKKLPNPDTSNVYES